MGLLPGNTKIYGFTRWDSLPRLSSFVYFERAPFTKVLGAFSFPKGASSIRADSCLPAKDDSGSILKKKCAYRPEAGFINSLKLHKMSRVWPGGFCRIPKLAGKAFSPRYGRLIKQGAFFSIADKAVFLHVKPKHVKGVNKQQARSHAKGMALTLPKRLPINKFTKVWKREETHNNVSKFFQPFKILYPASLFYIRLLRKSL